MGLISHPAQFSSEQLDYFADILIKEYRERKIQVVDPFGGVGNIHFLERMLPQATTYAIEIEPEFVDQALDAHPLHTTICADSTELLGVLASLTTWIPSRPTAIVTSPAFGNRMADNYLPDGTKRLTYAAALGRNVSPGSAGGMQWPTSAYRDLHRKVWTECVRVVDHRGLLILHIKDHIRDGLPQGVPAYHLGLLEGLGFERTQSIRLPASGMGYGANGDLRVREEHIMTFKLRR